MKRNLKYTTLVLLGLLFSASIASAQVAETTRAVLERGRNLLSNPGFESGGGSWGASGATFTHVTSGSNLLTGAGSATVDMSAGADYVQSSLIAIPNGLKGQACQARIATLGGDGTDKLQVLDNSDLVIAETTLVGDTGKKEYTNLYFNCPSSGSIRLRLTATQNSTTFAIDEAHLGGVITGYDVNGAAFVGSLSWPNLANCEWTTTQTSFAANYSNDNDCDDGARTVVGGVSDSSAGLRPEITILNASSQERYMLVVQGNVAGVKNSDDGVMALFAPFDGAGNQLDVEQVSVLASSPRTQENTAKAGTYIWTFTPSTSGNLVINLRGRDAVSDSVVARVSADGVPLKFSVFKYPLANTQAKAYHTANWKVDANISGASPDLGTSAQTSYVEITNSSLSMTQNSGSLSVGIPCSTTNAAVVGDLTCSSGSEGLGVTFNLPAPGEVLACASFSHAVATGASGQVAVTFQLVETAANAQTILQQGKSRAQSGTSTQNVSLFIPQRVCGTFTFTSSGQKTLRLMYEQSITATVSTNIIHGDAGANNGQRDFHIEVYPLGQQVPAPIVSGPFYAQRTTTTDDSAVLGDETIIADATTGVQTISLPTAVGAKGKRIWIYKKDTTSQRIIIDPNGSETVCGQTTVSLMGRHDNMMLESDGSGWISNNCKRRFALQVTCSSSSSIDEDPNQVALNIGNISSGVCTINLRTGTSSAAGNCVISDNGGSYVRTLKSTYPNGTSLTVRSRTGSNTGSASTVQDDTSFTADLSCVANR